MNAVKEFAQGLLGLILLLFFGLVGWAAVYNFQSNSRRDQQTKGYQECMSKVAANYASNTQEYDSFDWRLSKAEQTCRSAYPKRAHR